MLLYHEATQARCVCGWAVAAVPGRADLVDVAVEAHILAIEVAR